MRRLNLTIDEALYEEARAFGFVENKPISQIIRESLKLYFRKNEAMRRKAALVLEASDKEELQNIIKNDEFISNDEFKKKFNL